MTKLETQRQAWLKGFNTAAQGKWIAVKDKMPEKDGRYLVVEDHHGIWIGVSSMRNGAFDMPITHWMPLPEPPHG